MKPPLNGAKGSLDLVETGRKFGNRDTLRLSAFSAALSSDVVLTNYALHRGHTEYNPIARESINHLGIDAGMGLVGLASVILASGFYLLNKKIDAKFESRKIGAKNVLLGLTAIEAAATINGIAQLAM